MINVVALQGRVCNDIELRSTPQGVSVARFILAVDRNYQAQGQERQTDFIDCVAWRQTAEFVSKYFHKGTMMALEGSIQTQNFTDKNGQNRKAVEVVANNVSFCGNKEKTETDTPNLNLTKDDTAYDEIGADDDLPF